MAETGVSTLVLAQWDSAPPVLTTEWASKLSLEMKAVDVWPCYLLESRRLMLAELGSELISALRVFFFFL